jgi:hypothetical protein
VPQTSGIAGIGITLILSACLTKPATAVPDFAQQTGQPCATCHIGSFGPQLTPFGREFKLSGYTQTGGDGPAARIPLSAFTLGSFTNTARAQPAPAAADFGRNNNFALDQVSVFLAGRVNDNIGGFIQGTYSGTDHAFLLDNTDIRFTMTLPAGDAELRFGTSINNGPTVQDPFNSTFAWGYPYATSALAPTPTAQPLLAGGLIGNSAGLTGYVWYDRHVYFEAGAYGTFGRTLLSAAGQSLGPGSTRNLAPYVRAAYEWDWNNQSAYVGALFLKANINPATSTFTASGALGQDRYTDYAVDVGYQFLGDGTHIITAQGIFVHEDQALTGSFNAGNSSVVNSSLDQIRVNATYYYKNTYGLTLGWQYTWGEQNQALFPAQPVSGSANGKPNSNAFIIEADWIPFGKEDSWARPFANVKVGVQYRAYTMFNGGSRDYDGFGHDAWGNNTLFIFVWTAF